MIEVFAKTVNSFYPFSTHKTSETKYSSMDQVKFVEDSLFKKILCPKCMSKVNNEKLKIYCSLYSELIVKTLIDVLLPFILTSNILVNYSNS